MALGDQLQIRTAQITLLGADATKVLVAAPGAGKRVRVLSLWWNVLVSAAQACDIEGSDGADELVKLPATPGLRHGDLAFTKGWLLGDNVGVRIQPAAAAPSVHAVIEYVIEGQS